MGLFGAEKVSDPMADAVGEARERRRIERAARLEQKCEMLEQENAWLREKLDAKVEDAVDPTWVGRMRNTAVQNLRKDIEAVYEVSRERALALTKLDECELWLGRCEPKETAAPTLKGAASPADAPCLKPLMRMAVE